MTDTFANGPSTPGGAAPDAAPQAGDVTGTLAELERKLRELESELSSIGRRREVAGATPDPIETLPPAADQRLVDEALEPPAPVTSITPSDPVAAPAPVAPQAPFAPPGSVAPQAPIAPTPAAAAPASVAAGAGQPMKFMRPPESVRPRASREPADRSEPHGESEPQWAAARQERPRPSEAQLASLAELRRFRDRLERFARDLAAEYDALLGRVMSGLTSMATPAAAGPAPVEDPPAAQPMAEEIPAAQPMAEEIPAAPESPEDMLFEGRVELGVGPFYDIASLSAFERGLAGLPYVVEASVRRFEASHAVVDVRLAAPVALVRELRRTVESGFSVREVADGRVLLTFDES
jgi:hypothetical protein